MTHLTPERRAKFLARLAAGHTVSAAARVTGLTRQRLYQLRNEDQEFAAEWQDAEEQGTDKIEEEAFRRAVKGVRSTEPIYFMGVKVGEKVVVRYSDGLIQTLLKARRPDKYRELYKHEHTGKDGNELTFTLKLGEGDRDDPSA